MKEWGTREKKEYDLLPLGCTLEQELDWPGSAFICETCAVLLCQGKHRFNADYGGNPRFGIVKPYSSSTWLVITIY